MLRRIHEHARRGVLRLAVGPKSPQRAGLRRIGDKYGGWYIPPVDPTWICCTAGIGEDAAFDVALAEQGCTVLAIDPTPRAIAYIRPFLEEHSTLQLAPYAVWTEETDLEFFPPADPSNVSFSATNLQSTRDPLIVPAKPLPMILQEFGHNHAHLVKLDIEGAEYSVLDALDLDALGVNVLCVEYHFDDRGLKGMIGAIRRIESRGFRVAHVALTDVTFLRNR